MPGLRDDGLGVPPLGGNGRRGLLDALAPTLSGQVAVRGFRTDRRRRYGYRGGGVRPASESPRPLGPFGGGRCFGGLLVGSLFGGGLCPGISRLPALSLARLLPVVTQ